MKRARRQQGFTLVEMMVALVAGAIAISSIYYISASSSWHFQEQQRVAQTQQNLRMAMEHLRRDIARAGYLGTPNSAREQRCMTPATPITAVELVHGAGTSVLPNAAANGVEADTLRLTGNYVTSDSYLVNTFSAGGNSADLQQTWQAFRRTFGAADAGTYSAEAFEDVFRTGRWLHITTTAGYHFFVEITAQDGATASVTFNPAVPIGTPCMPGLGTGATIAPLTRIEYVVLNANATASLASLARSSVAEGTVHPVLVRREIDVDSLTVVDNTERVVAEYVANFDVDFIVDTEVTTGAAPNLQLQGDAIAAATLAPAANPHRARAAIVSLSLRSPTEDPRFAAGYDLDGDTTNGTMRVRPMTTQILMPNIANRVIRP